jgi:thiol-disulfide isomerase/thioredoxin
VSKAKNLRLRGRIRVAGVDCFRLEYRFPDDEYFKSFNAELDIGIHDYIPRRILTSYRFDNRKRVDDLLISDFEANPIVADTLFTPSCPIGYEFIRHTPPGPPILIDTGSLAPKWSLADGEAKIHSISDFRGGILLLDFWYTTCPPCMQSVPVLQKLHERFASQGVHVIGINCFDKDKVDPAGFIRRRGGEYQVLLHGDSVATQYRVTHFPTLYIVGPDGRVLHAEAGYSDDMEERLAELIRRYLSAGSDVGKQ